jgi:hypothetical protein
MTTTALLANRLISRRGGMAIQTLSPDLISAAVRPCPTELDARGPTPPPKPFVAVMAALRAIPPGHPQYIRTNEAPTDLLRALKQQGFDGHPRELADGTWRTLLVFGGAIAPPL